MSSSSSFDPEFRPKSPAGPENPLARQNQSFLPDEVDSLKDATLSKQSNLPRVGLIDLTDATFHSTRADRQKALGPIREAVEEGAKLCWREGLRFFETQYQLVNDVQLYGIAAYSGFPVRYSHPSFGLEFLKMLSSHRAGHSKISEMVINTDPCIAYLLKDNSLADQKMVIPHVYAHNDFFVNNLYFAHTDRKMLDVMADHAKRIESIADREGIETVEQFIDCCHSLQDLIDRNAPAFKMEPTFERLLVDEGEREEITARRLRASPHMDPFINPAALVRQELEREKQLTQKKEAKALKEPLERPTEDVLKVLLDHAPLKKWQYEILAMLREEAYYFLPQGQTKIMNEGWASYWHSFVMTQTDYCGPEHIVDYAEHNSKTLFMPPGRLNPYKLGVLLLRDIEERWDNGQFGSEWEQCNDRHELQHWTETHGEPGRGRRKIFEVRKLHNDVTFIDTFLTREFCERHHLFGFAFNRAHSQWEVNTKEFAKVKEQLLFKLTKHGLPIISAVETNHKNRGELYLKHEFLGAELELGYAKGTMKALHTLWGRPVVVETVLNDKPTRLKFDGSRELKIEEIKNRN